MNFLDGWMDRPVTATRPGGRSCPPLVHPPEKLLGLGVEDDIHPVFGLLYSLTKCGTRLETPDWFEARIRVIGV